MISIVINLSLWVFTIIGFVVYNLYSKNVKLEEIVQNQNKTLETLSSIIEESERTLKEIDQLGAFRSDDEIGFFFKAMQSIQEVLNSFKVQK